MSICSQVEVDWIERLTGIQAVFVDFPRNAGCFSHFAIGGTAFVACFKFFIVNWLFERNSRKFCWFPVKRRPLDSFLISSCTISLHFPHKSSNSVDCSAVEAKNIISQLTVDWTPPSQIAASRRALSNDLNPVECWFSWNVMNSLSLWQGISVYDVFEKSRRSPSFSHRKWNNLIISLFVRGRSTANGRCLLIVP